MTDASPSHAAERQRRCRRRRKLGLLLAAAEVPLRLAERLVQAGLLSEGEATDPERLGTDLMHSFYQTRRPAPICSAVGRTSSRSLHRSRQVLVAGGGPQMGDVGADEEVESVLGLDPWTQQRCSRVWP